jgi:MFS family permease
MNNMEMTVKPKLNLFSYENRVVLLLALSGGVAGIDMLSVTFLSPFIGSDLHLQNAQIGAIVGLQILAWSVGAIIVSILSDRQGKRRVFLVGAMLCFALFPLALRLQLRSAGC